MANSKRQLFLKRRLRVRNKLRKMNRGRLRLSVHRSNKNISAQLIDDVNGVTLASASTHEKDIGRRWQEQRRSCRQDRHSNRRTCEEGRRVRSLLRPWRFPLPRQSEGLGRSCA